MRISNFQRLIELYSNKVIKDPKKLPEGVKTAKEEIFIEYYFKEGAIRLIYTITHRLIIQNNIDHENYYFEETRIYEFMRVFNHAGDFLLKLEKAGIKLAKHKFLVQIADQSFYEMWLLKHCIDRSQKHQNEVIK